MDELLRIGLRVLFAYIVLHQLLRHAGHRVVAGGVGGGSEGGGLEVVLALIIGDLIDDLLWAEVPAAQFVAAAGTLAVFHVFVGFVRRSNTWLWKLRDGTPVKLLEGGAPQHTTMRAQRVNEPELAVLLRRAGVDRERWPEIRAVYLENSGAVSVLRRSRAKPAVHAQREQARRAAQ